MSATIDYVECPDCGEEAFQEQDTETLEIHIWCSHCLYDSDDEE